MHILYRTILGALLLTLISVLGVAGCGDDADDANDATVCETFEADHPGGGACSSIDDCNPIPCPCANGSTVKATLCVNQTCGGASFCESVCGSSGYVCAEPGDPDA